MGRSCNGVRLSFLIQSHLLIPLILNLLTAELLGVRVKIIYLPLIRILDITAFRKKIREIQKIHVWALVTTEVEKKQMSMEYLCIFKHTIKKSTTPLSWSYSCLDFNDNLFSNHCVSLLLICLIPTEMMIHACPQGAVCYNLLLEAGI